jgi:hypothetical protein
VFINHDALGIAAVSYASKMRVRRVVSKNIIRAKLLESGFTLLAGAI